MSYHGHEDGGNADVPTRNFKADGKPFCWENKNALRHIRDNIDPWRVPLAVYKALCEIASNRGSDDFRAGLTEIGTHCGYNSRAKLCEAIKDLEFYGLVDVGRTALKAPMSFRLLRCEVVKASNPKASKSLLPPPRKLPLATQ